MLVQLLDPDTPATEVLTTVADFHAMTDDFLKLHVVSNLLCTPFGSYQNVFATALKVARQKGCIDAFCSVLCFFPSPAASPALKDAYARVMQMLAAKLETFASQCAQWIVRDYAVGHRMAGFVLAAMVKHWKRADAIAALLREVQRCAGALASVSRMNGVNAEIMTFLWRHGHETAESMAAMIKIVSDETIDHNALFTLAFVLGPVKNTLPEAAQKALNCIPDQLAERHRQNRGSRAAVLFCNTYDFY